jgi:hypothetical protein
VTFNKHPRRKAPVARAKNFQLDEVTSQRKKINGEKRWRNKAKHGSNHHSLTFSLNHSINPQPLVFFFPFFPRSLFAFLLAWWQEVEERRKRRDRRQLRGEGHYGGIVRDAAPQAEEYAKQKQKRIGVVKIKRKSSPFDHLSLSPPIS